PASPPSRWWGGAGPRRPHEASPRQMQTKKETRPRPDAADQNPAEASRKAPLGELQAVAVQAVPVSLLTRNFLSSFFFGVAVPVLAQYSSPELILKLVP